MDYYHDLVTDKSWKLLLKLKKNYDFILIGGWAVYLYTNALKSKDIDLVINYQELEKLRNEFNLSKNDRLKKYEARQEEVQIDIYAPYYSNLGVPVEEIENFKSNLKGFIVTEKELLSILKQKALVNRADSVKGRKDLIDVVSLFSLPDFDWEKHKNIIKRFDLEADKKFIVEVITRTREIPELDLNPHKMARFKKKLINYLNS